VEVQVGPDVPAAVPSEPEAHPDETTGSHSDSQDSQAQPEEPEASSTGPKEPEAKPSIRKAGNWYITLQMALPTGKPAWEWDEDSQAELRCVSAASGEEDAFREFIQVDFASPPGRTRVGTFGSIELGKIGKDLKDFKVLSKKTIEVNGHEAYKAVYTFTQGQAKRKAQAYFFLPKATGLVVKCVSAADDYDSFSKTFEETVATIAWK
jgi:hypothetical protein